MTETLSSAINRQRLERSVEWKFNIGDRVTWRPRFRIAVPLEGFITGCGIECGALVYDVLLTEGPIKTRRKWGYESQFEKIA